MSVYRLSRLIALFVVAALLASVWGCRSSSDARRAERAPAERRVLRTASAPPTAEQLRNSPCGNPDWAKLPGMAGEEADEDDALPADGDQPADDQPADDQPSGEQPSGEQAHLMVPCP